jgi:putative addiction module component (TIGR02574 family)
VHLTKEEIFSLEVDERMRLIEDLWDSIDPNQLPIPESHRQLLDRALEEYRVDPEEGRLSGRGMKSAMSFFPGDEAAPHSQPSSRRH